MRNKLLVGADFERMLEDAVGEAREILGCENLLTHPDYLFVEPKGKKSIGVEEILPVVEKGQSRAVLSERSVAVIAHFESLTPPAQNKLLLTLESNSRVQVIGIASSLHTVLSTVKSRMQVVEYKRASLKDFSDFDDPLLSYHAFCGDLRLAQSRKEDLRLLEKVERDLETDPGNLLRTLHLLEEKDPEAVTTDRVMMRCVLETMKHALTKKALALSETDCERALIHAGCVALLDEEGALMRKPSHGRDDFFLAVMEVIEKTGK